MAKQICHKRVNMISSLALIFLLSLLVGELFHKVQLPKIIGMLLVGIIIGPYALNLLSPAILNISAELRKIALIIILIKAGLTLELSSLKKASRPAILLSFLPATFEVIAITIFAPIIFNISRLEAALLGAVLGAVSPAVVVPKMTELIENGYGKDKSIPEMILAGASLDDIFVIVLFSSFLSANQSGAIDLLSFASIPISIASGVTLGTLTGLIVSNVFKSYRMASETRTIVVLALAFALTALEELIKAYLPLSSLLAVVAMAATIKLKSSKEVTNEIAKDHSRLWLGAQAILFTLIGAAVDIRYTLNAGYSAILLLFISLLIRSIGVLLALLFTPLNKKERLFTIFAYIPKATVQAAIGGIPLAMGLSCGSLVLSIAVLSILITAPLGAFLMDISYKKLLVKNTN